MSTPALSSGLNALSGLPPLLTVDEFLQATPRGRNGIERPALPPNSSGVIQARPRAVKVPLHLGRAAPAPAVGAGAAELTGTRPAGSPIAVKATAGAFANPAGSGAFAALDATKKLDSQTVVGLQLKNTWVAPRDGASTQQTRLRGFVNRTVLDNQGSSLVLGARAGASFSSSLRDGASSVSYGVGVTASYTYKPSSAWSVGVSGSIDYNVSDPSRGPTTGNWVVDGKLFGSYAFGTDGNDVVSAALTGFRQINNDGTDADGLALGIEYLHKIGQDMSVGLSVYRALEGSNGGPSDVHSPRAGGVAVQLEASFRF